MALPSLKVAADFTSAALVIPTNWTDLSARARSATISRGRQRLLARTETGSASVTLDNRDRTLDPSLHPTVRPSNHLRIQAVYNGVTYDLFRGYVRAWPQEWPGHVDAISAVSAEDAFSLMARYELAGDSITQQLSGAHIGTVLSLYGWPATGSVPAGSTWWLLGTAGKSELGTTTYLGESARGLDDGRTTIMATTLTGNLLEHLLNVAETTEAGTLYMGPSGDVVFRQRPTDYGVPIGVWGDDTASGELPYFDLVMSYADDRIYNDIRIQRRGDSVTYSNTDSTSSTSYGPRTLSLSDTLYAFTTDATNAASEYATRYKDPQLVPVKMVLRPKPDNAQWPQSTLWQYILTARPGDRITVIRRPPGGGAAISTDCLILGMNLEINPDFWEATWDLEAIGQILAAWYLNITGKSELGLTTTLA